VTTTKEKRQTRKTLGIPEDAFVIAHIGRMYGGDRSDSSLAGGQKAQDVLIRAFAKAFFGNPQCVLVLVGDGPLRLEAESLAKNLGIAEDTRFLGRQPEPWPALRAADMFCFPSRHEGLPNVLPEAASCGLPVVASDIPAIRQLCPGDAWLLRPVDDIKAFAEGLRTVRANLAQFSRLAGEAADGFRERFSMAVCAGKYLQAYELALGWNVA
jgi:glycosyltransferase involved in cell wall biosynthesis